MSGMIIQGRYRLETPLARGGMSVLYKATQLLLGRTVAVKIMAAPITTVNDAELEQRFLVEARAAAQLRHPNSIVVHEYGRTDEGHYFIAMEYLEGRDLARAIADDGPFAPARAQHIALQVCESLIEAHELGIVHRDIKPLNVFLSQVGGQPDHVKVLDFGLAKLLGDASAVQTRAGRIMGTPAYMSPEQVVGDVDVIDARSDIYSFGALLFHMLAGDAPFGTTGDYALMEAHIKRPVPSLRSIHRACRASAQLEAVIRCCMAKDPTARYTSMREVADALAACPAERRTPVRWARVAGVATAAGALGAVLLGVWGPPGGSEPSGARPAAAPAAATTAAAPAGPSTEPATGVAPLFEVVAAAAVEPSGAAELAAAEQPALAGEAAAAGQPSEVAKPAPAIAGGAAEQPATPAADPLVAATSEAPTSPPRARGTERRPMSRRAISRRPATRPRRARPATRATPPSDKPQQPAAKPPAEDRPGPAVRRNPDPWAE
jgi:eukaryotic-like serine/threonine-protein kinase